MCPCNAERKAYYTFSHLFTYFFQDFFFLEHFLFTGNWGESTEISDMLPAPHAYVPVSHSVMSDSLRLHEL